MYMMRLGGCKFSMKIELRVTVESYNVAEVLDFL